MSTKTYSYEIYNTNQTLHDTVQLASENASRTLARTVARLL